jgi:hypothetical protein
MRRLAMTLIAGTALLALTTAPTLAQDYDASSTYGSWDDEESWEDDYSGYGTAEVINGQVNLGTVWSAIDASVNSIDSSVTAVTQSVGNTVNIYTMSNTYVDNSQIQQGDVGAEVNLEAWEIGGDVLVGATSLCNGAGISTDPDVTAINSYQSCNADDPSATINANVSDVAGGVGMAAVAVSNQIQVDTNAANFPINSYQESAAHTFATVNATVSGAAQVDLSGSAVGNNATFIHY